MNFLQLIDQKWRSIHLLLVKHKNKLELFFLILELVVLSTIPLAYLVRLSYKNLFITIYELGGQLGTISFFLYLSTHIPSILKRFKILPLLSSSITLFRRHLGILMFVLAVAHASIVSTIPMLFAYGKLNFSVLGQREIWGVIGLAILFPLWLTSNNLSQRYLGRYWKMLQRFTYLALFFIYLHVALVELSNAILGAVIATLIIISWIYAFVTKKEPSSA